MTSILSHAEGMPGRDAADLGRDLLKIDLQRAVTVGIIAAVFIALSTYAVGQIGNAKASLLLEAILPTTRFLASSVLSASATILALMLTVLSLSKGDDQTFSSTHFSRVRQIALLCSVMLCMSVFVLLVLNVPLKEAEQFQQWYRTLYVFIVSISAVLGGAMITTIIMLYAAVSAIIRVVDPNEKADIISEGEDDGESRQSRSSSSTVNSTDPKNSANSSG